MHEKFNLIIQPWIPCVDRLGKNQKYGLLEVLSRADELAALLSPAPVVKASLYRLLLCILGRIFDPRTVAEWVQLREAGTFNNPKLHAYLDQWAYRFNLFDEQRPFFQARDERVRIKALLKMVPHLSSGNNATLFDHSTEEGGVTFAPDEAALYLVALQYYGLGGLSGIEPKFTAAPPCRGISFFVQGRTLFETLLLNMIPAGDDSMHAIPIYDAKSDRPCWEMDDPFQARKTPYGLFDYLTWQNRRVLLFPEQEDGRVVVRKMTEAPGLRLDDQFIDGVAVRDPYQYYRMGSQGPTELRFDEERALWRDSAALFRFEDQEAGLLSPPNLMWLSILVKRGILAKSATLQVNALGMAANKSKVLFYGDENLPLPAGYLEDINQVGDLQNALELAEKLSKSLYGAVSGMAEIIISFDCDLKGSKPDRNMVDTLRQHLRGDRIFWAGLENGFSNLVVGLPGDRENTLRTWQELLRSQAWAALEYSERLAGDDLRARKAAVKARAIVGGAIKEHLDLLEKEVSQ